MAENVGVLRKIAGLEGAVDLFKNMESQKFEVSIFIHSTYLNLIIFMFF